MLIAIFIFPHNYSLYTFIENLCYAYIVNSSEQIAVDSDVLIILAHPSRDSLCGAIADSYAQGSGGEVVNIYDMNFDWSADPRNVDQKEPAILEMQDKISRAKHVAFIYPMWWGTAPSSLKAFIDLAFSPGFAFKYRAQEKMPLRLLKGRTARIFITMDAPKFWHWLAYRASGTSWLKWASLWFSGFKVLKTVEMNGVRSSNASRRGAWLSQAEKLGVADRRRTYHR
jgi:NAD(P)H dehydrogenase (quinone)